MSDDGFLKRNLRLQSFSDKVIPAMSLLDAESANRNPMSLYGQAIKRMYSLDHLARLRIAAHRGSGVRDIAWECFVLSPETRATLGPWPDAPTLYGADVYWGAKDEYCAFWYEPAQVDISTIFMTQWCDAVHEWMNRRAP